MHSAGGKAARAFTLSCEGVEYRSVDSEARPSEFRPSLTAYSCVTGGSLHSSWLSLLVCEMVPVAVHTSRNVVWIKGANRSVKHLEHLAHSKCRVRV